MGCITTRETWPPKADPRPAVRNVYELVLVDGQWKKVLVQRRRDDDRRQQAGRQ
jgi:hypothetical protein